MTFLEYLTDYMRRLSYNETTDIKLLAYESQTNNHRLIEPMSLYALFSGQTDELFHYVEDEKTRGEYLQLLSTYTPESMEFALKEQSNNLRERYTRVWKSYLCRANRPQREARVRNLMKDKDEER